MAASRRRKFTKVIAYACASLAALLLLVCLTLPLVLPWLPRYDLMLDFSSRLTPEQRALVPDPTLRVQLGFVPADGSDVCLEGRGEAFGQPLSLCVNLRYSLFRLRAAGDLAVEFGPLKADGGFSGAATEGWTVDAAMKPTLLTEKEPFLAGVFAAQPEDGLRDVTCSGLLGFQAHASTTNGLAVPVWTASVQLANFSAAFRMGESAVSIDRANVRVGADGIGSHVDIRPSFPKIAAVRVNEVTLTNVYAVLRASERAILVSEAGADLFGGEIRLYSFFLNPERLDAGVTVFVDEVETASLLNCIDGFRGDATGRLHGKVSVRLRRGERLSVGDAFLYSVPGETGKIRVSDPTPILDQLAMTGTSPAVCENLGKALGNLDYSVLNVSMRKEKDGDYALMFKLEGSATSGETAVPVTFALTIHGDFDQLINTGFRASLKR